MKNFIHFSEVTKMPCSCWSIPSALCITGQKLIREGAIKNIPYVCRVCYTHQGPTRFRDCQSLLWQNFEGYSAHPHKWVLAMTKALLRSNALYFRWFHSGDLQDAEMLLNILEVAIRNPRIQFWLPTQERDFVELIAPTTPIPRNLNIRITSSIIDVIPQNNNTPGVTESMVCYNQPITCPAHKQGHWCNTCRICWNRDIALVAYPLKSGRNYWPRQTATRLGLI